MDWTPEEQKEAERQVEERDWAEHGKFEGILFLILLAGLVIGTVSIVLNV